VRRVERFQSLRQPNLKGISINTMPIARYLPEKNPREAAFSAKGAEAIEIAFRNPKFRSSTESSYISPRSNLCVFFQPATVAAAVNLFAFLPLACAVSAKRAQPAIRIVINTPSSTWPFS
jgi:hypothetical protein